MMDPSENGSVTSSAGRGSVSGEEETILRLPLKRSLLVIGLLDYLFIIISVAVLVYHFSHFGIQPSWLFALLGVAASIVALLASALILVARENRSKLCVAFYIAWKTFQLLVQIVYLGFLIKKLAEIDWSTKSHDRIERPWVLWLFCFDVVYMFAGFVFLDCAWMAYKIFRRTYSDLIEDEVPPDDAITNGRSQLSHESVIDI